MVCMRQEGEPGTFRGCCSLKSGHIVCGGSEAPVA